MREQALSMTEAKEKLANLEGLIPGAPNPLIYDFGRFLAGYLNVELVPQGFVMACELALYDLQKGVSGYTGKPIENRLVDYPPMIYSLLRMEVPNIAAAVLPADFAEGVKTFVEQVNEEVRKKRVNG
jgi:hypothetical protein